MHIFKDDAILAWNNPLTKNERYYSETELRDIFEMLFVEQEIQDYFLKRKNK